jgi:hypothetical protein
MQPEELTPVEADRFRELLETHFPWIAADEPMGNLPQRVIDLHEALASRSRQ